MFLPVFKQSMPLQLLLMAAKGQPAYIVQPPPEQKQYFAFGNADNTRGNISYDYSSSDRKNRKSQITASFVHDKEQQ